MVVLLTSPGLSCLPRSDRRADEGCTAELRPTT